MLVIERVRSSNSAVGAGIATKDELFNDSRLFLETVTGSRSEPQITPTGFRYEQLYIVDPEAAWRWLSIRSGWLCYWPNSSQSMISKISAARGESVNLFDSVLRTLSILDITHPGQNGVSFAEFFAVMDDDEAWGWSLTGFSKQISQLRSQGASLDSPGETVLKMEENLGLPRDSLNTFFCKFLVQTGLVTIVSNNDTGVKHERFAIDPAIWNRPGLLSQYRHVLKYPDPLGRRNGTA